MENDYGLVKYSDKMFKYAIYEKVNDDMYGIMW